MQTMPNIERPTLSAAIEALFRANPVVMLLERVFIVYPGGRSYPLYSWADVVALYELPICLGPMLKSGKGKRRRRSAKDLNIRHRWASFSHV